MPKIRTRRDGIPDDIQKQVTIRAMRGESAREIAEDYGYTPERILQISRDGRNAIMKSVIQATG